MRSGRWHPRARRRCRWRRERSGGAAGANFAAEETQARFDEAGGRKPAAFAAELLHAGEQGDAENGESEIGEPDAEEGWNDALAGEPRAGDYQQVISSNHDYGD